MQQQVYCPTFCPTRKYQLVICFCSNEAVCFASGDSTITVGDEAMVILNLHRQKLESAQHIKNDTYRTTRIKNFVTPHFVSFAFASENNRVRLIVWSENDLQKLKRLHNHFALNIWLESFKEILFCVWKNGRIKLLEISFPGSFLPARLRY